MRNMVFTAALVLGLSPLAEAQDLVYTPVNPSFGGNPFNSSHLLGIAEIDRPDPPSGSDDPFGRDRTSQTDFFVRQLESRILSQLSQNITEKIFGEDAEPSGTFTFNQTQLNFETLLDGTILVEILDLSTGSVTNIEIPAFLTASSN